MNKISFSFVIPNLNDMLVRKVAMINDYMYLYIRIKWWVAELMKEMPLVRKYYVKFDWWKRRTKTEILLTWMIWDVPENKIVIAKKKKTTTRWYKGKQTNNNSSNFGRMLAGTDYQAGRCLYISVWSMTMVTTTSDQSEPMRKINKPYGNRWFCVVDTEKLLKETWIDHRLSQNTYV